jgi:hypothetical protein
MMKLLRSQCLLPLVLVSFSGLAQAQNLFLTPPTYQGGPCLAADLNDDGKLDLVCGDGTVQLGNGDGTFKGGTPWSVPGTYLLGTLLGTADFNGDGKADLLVTGPYTDPTSLYVLLGNGDATFRAPVKTNIGTSLVSVVVADINGDGKPDVVGTSNVIGLVVLLGKGDGTFMPGTAYPLSNGGYLTTGDFNGDGKQDVAIAIGVGTAGQVSVFLGNGDGTLKTPAITSVAPSSPLGIAAADLNGDGKLDLLVPEGYSSQTYALLGKGDGTFSAPAPAANASGGIVVTDLNGDGKPDLVVGTDFVRTFLGNGDGTFTFKVAYLIVGATGDMTVGDFNGDGKQDIAAANQVLLGNGDGTFKDSSALHGLLVSAGAGGDFNGDGVPDMAVLTYSIPAVNSGDSISILIGDRKGNFSVTHTYALPEPVPSCSIGCIATADVNGDGKLDLIVPGNDPVTHNLTLEVLLGNGDGTFGPSFLLSPQALYTGGVQMALADLNGDHMVDVAVLTGGMVSDVSVLLNNGDGTFGSPTSYFAGSQVNSFVVADFNNDGKLDIASGSAAGLGVLLGKGDGTFQPAAFSGASGVFVEAAADLNRDGNVDLITDHGILLGNGDGTFDVLPSAPLLRTRAVVDVNGDGKLDLVGDLEVAALYAVAVQLGNGDGTFGNAITVGTGANAKLDILDVVGTADVKGNGQPDLFVSFVNTYSWEGGLAILQNTVGPLAPDFLVSAAALSPKVVLPGDSASSKVTLTAISGFNGSVLLSCNGLPSGTSCSFAPSSVSGSGASTLTITTSASTPAGTYPVEIVAAGPTLTHDVTLTLTLATSAGATTVGVAPSSLVFATQTGTASSPQMVQLTNTGTAQLAILSLSLTGQNPGDFAISNNGCGSTLAAGTSCAIQVTFIPAGTGGRSASLSISDNATGSPQIVTLSGTAPDFSLAVSSSSSATVMPGQTATYSIAIAPSGGFNQTVTLACNGTPPLSSCAVSPNSVALNGTSSASATVTVTTTAPSKGLLPYPPALPWKMDHRPLLFPLALFAIITVALLASVTREIRVRRVPKLSLMILGAAGMLLASCGGGSGGSNSGSAGTQAGTYTISITASAASGSGAATHTTTVTLVVQ